MLAALKHKELEYNAKIASEMVSIYKGNPVNASFLQQLVQECIAKISVGRVEEVRTFGQSFMEGSGLLKNDDGLVVVLEVSAVE